MENNLTVAEAMVRVAEINADMNASMALVVGAVTLVIVWLIASAI